MLHNFKAFPELTNSQMDELYMESPHKQIFENFKAKVKKVRDGDTIVLEWEERDFAFPLRVKDIDAPELNIKGGHEAKAYLQELIEGEDVEIIIDPKNRVEKWGRLLGDISFNGTLVSEDMIRMGLATPFERRREGIIVPIERAFNIKEWWN